MNLRGPKIRGMKIYDVFQDPGHGWCRVPRKDIERFKIEEQISHYSYQHGEYVFLEEDRDFPIFITALTVHTRKKFTEFNHYFRYHISNRRSKIRSYERYERRKINIEVPRDRREAA